ncbi:uncharacterized protein LOC113777244 [Coffea eugenioides]|uniref:uncharacterized protein LOC113777244 n=1 Tax=Coffea eugenioides TaxID=49369 RepID=UPI000F6116D7|nr:uncharacterized protein LOC113777244 [Coffea eugenioides]
MWVYNPREEIEFEKGQLFTNVDSFRAALKDYVIQKGFLVVRLKNEKTRVTAICGIDGCKWRIHASPVADSITFMIKSYQPEHTCVMDKGNVEATSDWIAKKLVPLMRDHPNISSQGIEAEMIAKYGIKPSYMQLFRAKKKTKEEIQGNFSDSYGKLPKCAALLRQYNPQSICKIHYDRPNLLVELRFLRIFVSFRTKKTGFLEGCRLFIGFDGCHLKGPFSGVLLTAVALDRNDSIFPIAFAVAECKNKETWSWFFHFFEEFFGPFNSHLPLTFMSDRQKVLLRTIYSLFGHVEGSEKAFFDSSICCFRGSTLLMRRFFQMLVVDIVAGTFAATSSSNFQACYLIVSCERQQRVMIR